MRFDLFHGNYPYMGDALFPGKNYPNAALNLCWLYIIDPIYAEEMLQRAVVTLPGSKIYAFGGDYIDHPEYSGVIETALVLLSGRFCVLYFTVGCLG